MGLVALTVGLNIGPLADNSFFTHLATGRYILDHGGIPRVDPYTFTAQGEPWVVQSWLVSLLYGLVDDVAGGGGLRLLAALLAAGVMALAWTLTRPTQGIVVRLGLGALVAGVGAGLWAERPFMVGLIALGLTVLAAEGRLDPRWLLPVGWIWLNSHGSFPLGVAYLVVVLAGERLDGSPLGTTARALKWLVIGLLAGVVNPLGPRLLLFPVELLQRQDVLRHVQEWQAPTFTTLSERIFLLQLGLAVLALVRRPSYRSGLVVVVFTAAALLGARNMAVASLVFVPVLAGAWSRVGALRSDSRSRVGRVLTAVSLAMLVVIPVGSLRRAADYELDSYPVDSLEFLQEEGVDLEEVHLAGPERVGNLLGLRDGPGGTVFFDDRFDMFPDDVNAANLTLFDGAPERDEVLEDYDISLVLFPRLAPLTQLLRMDEAWRTLNTEKDWTLLCRIGDDLGGSLGPC